MRANVLEILILIARIDAEEVVRVGNFVNQQVIDEGALLGHQPGIMRLPDGEFGRVVARDVLDQIKRALSTNFDLAHVADVEQACGGARGHVFGEDAGILHGHIPAAEVNHPGVQAPVRGVQCGLAKLCRGWRCHS